MLASGMPLRVIWYSWSRMLPWASSSSPPASWTVNRSRNGAMIAFLTVAIVSPPRSMAMVSRARSR